MRVETDQSLATGKVRERKSVREERSRILCIYVLMYVCACVCVCVLWFVCSMILIKQSLVSWRTHTITSTVTCLLCCIVLLWVPQISVKVWLYPVMWVCMGLR